MKNFRTVSLHKLVLNCSCILTFDLSHYDSCKERVRDASSQSRNVNINKNLQFLCGEVSMNILYYDQNFHISNSIYVCMIRPTLLRASGISNHFTHKRLH